MHFLYSGFGNVTLRSLTRRLRGCAPLLLLAWPLVATAQVAPLIANLGARQNIDMDGRWQVIVDPFDTGFLDYRSKPLQNNNAFFKNHKPGSKSELVEYDFDSSGQLNVPGDWNTQRDTLLFYEGSVWYKHSFDYSKPAHERLFLHFGAVNYRANVYFNGDELGEHVGGFTPFDFEVTDKVLPTGNFIVVRANNARGKEEVPTTNTDWWNYGGITRPVTLVRVPETFVQDYLVQLEKGSTRQIKGWVQLNGPQPLLKHFRRMPQATRNLPSRVAQSYGLRKIPSYIEWR